jgi:HPt (histidine-containing phosphotransfer) domain-containing protein
MNDYLYKPIDARELNRLLGKWLPQDMITQSEGIDEVPYEIQDEVPDAIDRATGLINAMNDMALYHSLLKDFRSGHGKDPEKIKAALDAGDYHTARRLAHTLKSTSNLIGAKNLGGAALSIEDAITEHDAVPTREMWEELEKEYNAVMAELERSIPAEPPGRAYGEGELDIKGALVLMRKLEPLLKTNNGDSLNLLDDIAEILGPAGEESGKLIALIENLDFPEALELFKQIREKILAMAGKSGAAGG